MAVRRRPGPKMRSSRQGDGAGSRESEQMVTPTPSTNTNLVRPLYALPESRQRLRLYDKETPPLLEQVDYDHHAAWR
jgi:hypothetical protein